MPKGIGRLIQFGLAKESVRGTAVLPSAGFWMPTSELAFDEKDEKIVQDQSLGVIEDSNGELIVKQWSEGTIKAPVTDKAFALFLYSLFGTLNSANHAGETIVKDHTITVAQTAQHQSLTFFVNDPVAAADYSYALGVVDSLEIKYEIGKLIEINASIKAKKGTAGTLTAGATSENVFLPQHLTVKLATTAAGLDAAAAVIVKSASIKISQNIEDDDVLGSLDPADFLTKQISIEGSLELLWEDETYKTLSLAATKRAMRLDLVHTATIGNTAHPEIKIDLNNCILQEVARSIKNNDTVKQTLKFKAHYDITDQKMVQVVVTNLQISY